jgi:hypothetical protein
MHHIVLHRKHQEPNETPVMHAYAQTSMPKKDHHH